MFEAACLSSSGLAEGKQGSGSGDDVRHAILNTSLLKPLQKFTHTFALTSIIK